MILSPGQICGIPVAVVDAHDQDNVVVEATHPELGTKRQFTVPAWALKPMSRPGGFMGSSPGFPPQAS